ncbi:MAG: hypothetical protein H6722_29305 [Sandaracinus sp.]|nr:hypothetical protein [Sandaracinus sp.]MCB9617975.1 hypothetical protein [Sandaracinus sp.]MCB9622480.1 hypothetical protein [Sandaracinus sp.]
MTDTSHISLLARELVAVLQRVPGLELMHAEVTPTRCAFDVTVDRWDALLLLADSGFASNVECSSYSTCRPGSPKAAADPARAIVHQFLLTGDSIAEDLEVLGAFLVWSMHRLGWMATEEANRVLEVFRASPVPRPIL